MPSFEVLYFFKLCSMGAVLGTKIAWVVTVLSIYVKAIFQVTPSVDVYVNVDFHASCIMKVIQNIEVTRNRQLGTCCVTVQPVLVTTLWRLGSFLPEAMFHKVVSPYCMVDLKVRSALMTTCF